MKIEPSGGKSEGKHQGSAIIDTVGRGSQRREKWRSGLGKGLETGQPGRGYNRGRNESATPTSHPSRRVPGENCEANFSTKHAPPGKNPWFPGADAHTRRPGGDCSAQTKGPGPTYPLNRGNCLVQVKQSLRSPAEFRRVFRGGNSVKTPHLVVHIARSSTNERGRYGLVVSRKVGGAVVRNRLRRQLRAAIAAAGGWRGGFDAVVVFKGTPPVKTGTLAEEIRKIFDGSGAPGRGALR